MVNVIFSRIMRPVSRIAVDSQCFRVNQDVKLSLTSDQSTWGVPSPLGFQKVSQSAGAAKKEEDNEPKAHDFSDGHQENEKSKPDAMGAGYRRDHRAKAVSARSKARWALPTVETRPRSAASAPP
jgi:hypothetical protein